MEFKLVMSNIPIGVEYKDIVTFWNQHIRDIRFIKLTLIPRLDLQSRTSDAVVQVRIEDATIIKEALNGKSMRATCISVRDEEKVDHRNRSIVKKQFNSLHVNKEIIRSIVISNYNRNTKTLHLSNLVGKHNDDLFKPNFECQSFVSTLIHIISMEASDVISLNLASNEIKSLVCFQSMHRKLPFVANISLMDNNICDINQLENFASYTQLRELLLFPNPFFHSFKSLPSNTLHNVVNSFFPKLQLLDHMKVVSLIDFGFVPESNVLPAQRNSYFDTIEHQHLVALFVRRYFEIYDRDRQSKELFDLYAEQAQFSLAYGSTQSNSNSNSNSYSNSVSKPILLRTKAFEIINAIYALPSSIHDLNSFTADVVKVPSEICELNQHGGLLHVSLRGKFNERGTLLRYLL
jgi:hypothetical protein